ncbi:hypothetical protein ACFOUP_13170 [Belliella kenyensis]|uniref:Uncharacterized protein n=1 Tax=Belliella kenyensis TaxID=1472724 RepID=A0ABV8ENF8_9BACT|nr:hypothetical protein [Belliella kenyensis]MCH7403568.1 hypothetical protein [Belliella kenyensis]MDN3603880.1 hypothetical protein [Belliella kenyensis]
MFDGPDYPASLHEDVFEEWLEKGRESKIPFAYLLIIWDEIESKYSPYYSELKSEIYKYARYGQAPDHQLLVAAYDLYSESRVL